MNIVQKISHWVKSNIFQKSFILGLIMAVGLFSHYIFGANNLAEEIAEAIHKILTGIEIDFTPHVPEK